MNEQVIESFSIHKSPAFVYHAKQKQFYDKCNFMIKNHPALPNQLLIPQSVELSGTGASALKC